LIEIKEIAAYIKKYRHLPEGPSANEVAQKGLEVAKMDATLLKKIEEIWLHIN